MDVCLTPAQKDAVRMSPCSLCLATPPFADGSRCHPHRIVQGRDGGRYTPENVIPLCPKCHRSVDRMPCIEAAAKGGRARQALLTPEEKVERAIRQLNSPASLVKRIRTRNERQRRQGRTPKEMEALRERGRKGGYRTQLLHRDLYRERMQEMNAKREKAGVSAASRARMSQSAIRRHAREKLARA